MQGAAVNVDATAANSLYMGEKPQEGKPGHNNYGRPEGQNVGNFLTDRNSSRVLAPPGETRLSTQWVSASLQAEGSHQSCSKHASAAFDGSGGLP